MRHIIKYHIVITQIRYFFEYYLVIFFSTIIHLMHGIFQILGIINKKIIVFHFICLFFLKFTHTYTVQSIFII